MENKTGFERVKVKRENELKKSWKKDALVTSNRIKLEKEARTRGDGMVCVEMQFTCNTESFEYVKTAPRIDEINVAILGGLCIIRGVGGESEKEKC